MITTLKVTNLNFDTAPFAWNHLRVIVINLSFISNFFDDWIWNLWEIELFSSRITIRWKQLISYISLLMKVKKYIIMQITLNWI